MNNHNDIKKSIDEVKSHIEDSTKGLPEEVFLFATTITPMINVDLLVKNSRGQVLMSWRDDMCGTGWHIPGGIIRFKETFHDRLLKVGESELHTRITHDDNPLMINQIILKQEVRGHFVSLLYRCYVPDDYVIDNGDIKEGQAGYLKWIDKCPDNFVTGQRDIYNNLWDEIL